MEKQTTDPLVSIIIPVYNIEKYLRDTLDSVAAQTYQNLEVLLVDDGSTDSSGAICDEYSARYPFFKTFHKKNSGVSGARNYALQRFSGSFVMFIDSDDMVKPQYVSVMVDAAIKYDSEMVTCRHLSGLYNTPEMFWDYKCSDDPEIIRMSLDNYSSVGPYRHNVVWRGIYSAHLVEGLEFPVDIHIAEDTLFFYQMAARAEQWIIVWERYYYYRIREESLIHKEFNSRQVDNIRSWARVCELFKDRSEAFLNDYRTSEGLTCKRLIESAIRSGYKDRKLISDMTKRARELNRYVQRSENITPVQKRNYALFVMSPRLFIKFKEITHR